MQGLQDVKKRENVTFDSVRYFAERFSCLGLKSRQQMDTLEEEFLSYQVDDLPKYLTASLQTNNGIYIGQL